jgi:hypothetical protein
MCASRRSRYALRPFIFMAVPTSSKTAGAFSRRLAMWCQQSYVLEKTPLVELAVCRRRIKDACFRCIERLSLALPGFSSENSTRQQHCSGSAICVRLSRVNVGQFWRNAYKHEALYCDVSRRGRVFLCPLSQVARQRVFPRWKQNS